MAYSASKIECVRFAGRHQPEGIGCCAIDEFQGFINDPDQAAHVPLRHGDTLTSLLSGNGKKVYLGPTNRDIFEAYLRIGTFSLEETPNRMFLASLTQEQCGTEIGKKWLTILKENGFEFIRAVDNSVYSGEEVSREQEDEGTPVYLFGLFRNIGTTRLSDPFAPPEYWKELPEPEDDFTIWEKGKLHVLTEEEATGTTKAKEAAPNPVFPTKPVSGTVTL